MKGMADSLRDLGEPVPDRTLVLNLLCGLSHRYNHLKALIKRTMSFPSFHDVRNELLLEELTLEAEPGASATALWSTVRWLGILQGPGPSISVERGPYTSSYHPTP